MNNKNTLEWYTEKSMQMAESFSDSSWGSELLFKARI